MENLQLVRTKLMGLLFQIIVSILAAILYFECFSIDEPMAEIMKRIRTPEFDLMVAVSGGVIGTLGYAGKEKSNSVIFGATMSVILFPPLCILGYGVTILDAEMIQMAAASFLKINMRPVSNAAPARTKGNILTGDIFHHRNAFPAYINVRYYGYGVLMRCKPCVKEEELPRCFPKQHQNVQPGIESIMVPKPIFDDPCYVGCGKLQGKIALITGGDSGIGRAVAIAFAKEGADVAISYLYEEEDAKETQQWVESYGGKCRLYPGDIRDQKVCQELVKKVVGEFGALDILVNNAGVQFPQPSLQEITKSQLQLTYEVNVFPMFYLTQEALCYMKPGSTIVNTASVTAYEGHVQLIDYSSTKGAVVSFTRSLSLTLAEKNIRVNAVAPGPIWTPLIVSSFSAEDVSVFGQDVPMRRAGQPYELAPAYVYLASRDSTYVTGQVIHVNGGTMTES